MLMLTRRAEEAITITAPDGQKIVIRVISVLANGQVRLGFDAPRDFHILRDNAVKKEKDA